MTVYIVEIYEPGRDALWAEYKSATPLMDIAVGQLIHPWSTHIEGASENLMRVVNVEHIIWKIDGTVSQKVMVFTEIVPGARSTRLTKID